MKNERIKNQYRVNEQIRAKEVRIVNEGGSTVMPTRQALDMARSQGVDLVEISPNAQPPVCRIIDYSKFLYQQKKHAKEMKAKQVKVEVKEIKKYEEELYHFLDSDAEAVNVMQAIVSTGKLDEESEKKLNDSLTRFTEEFLKRL